MSVRDFRPRPQNAPTDSVPFLDWLDALGRRQNIDLQQELTTVADGDFFYVFDVDETGPVKTKKASVSNIGARILASGVSPGFGGYLSNNTTDSTNDIDISVGARWDSSWVSRCPLAAMTKRLDANWSPGTGNGVRYSGASIANTTYHIFAVWKADLTQDYYAYPAVATPATVLAALQSETGGADYVYLKRIGAILRVGGVIKPFLQTGNKFQWRTPVADISGAANTSVTTRTLSAIPVGLKVTALLTVFGYADVAAITYVSDPDVDTSAASSPYGTIYNIAGQYAAAPHQCTTNTSAQVSTDSNGTNALLTIFTNGFIDYQLGDI